MDAERERRLVESCRGGKTAAYADLIKTHSRRVFAVCFGMLGSAADAEDCAQEAFMKGFTAIGRLRGGDRFGSWIVRIARNECIDRLRRRRLEAEALTALRNGRREPDGARRDLEDAVMRLPERFRVPLLLYYFDGRSTESVANALDVSPGAVHTRLCRARRALRRLLDGKGVSHE